MTTDRSGYKLMLRRAISMLVICCVSISCCAELRPCQAQGLRGPAAPLDSPLLTEPTTPEETFAVILTMMDLARFDLARQYLDQLLAAEPDEATLLKLRELHGTGEFLRLARTRALQPSSEKLLERLNAAAQERVNDPQFVDKLIDALMGDVTARELAVIELRNLGPAAVPYLLARTGQQIPENEQAILVDSLVRMGTQVVPPVMAGLQARSESTRLASVQVLQLLRQRDAAQELWVVAYDPEELPGVQTAAQHAVASLVFGDAKRTDRLSSVLAVRELERLAKQAFRREVTVAPEADGRVTRWMYDSTSDRVVLRRLKADLSLAYDATRFARSAFRISPDREETQRQYLAAALNWDVLTRGWDQPVSFAPGSAGYVAVSAGPDVVAAVLSDSMRASQPASVLAATLALGQIGSRAQVRGGLGSKSPLLAALNYPDPRVQFAAADAILKLDPDREFSGSDRVVEVLARTLSGAPVAHAVIIDTDDDRGSMTAGYVDTIGLTALRARTGKAGFELAASTTGVELVVIEASVTDWGLAQTLANLRADTRTAYLPIVIVGPVTARAAGVAAASRHAPAVFVEESGAAVDFTSQVRPFRNQLTTPPLTQAQLEDQRAVAVEWFAHIASGHRTKVFNLALAEERLFELVSDPGLGESAVIALGSIPTVAVQQRLEQVATNNTLPGATRQTAAIQLASHIQRHGLLLTGSQVEELRKQWSATPDRNLKLALATVMGTMKPGQSQVGERLRSFSPAIVPQN